MNIKNLSLKKIISIYLVLVIFMLIVIDTILQIDEVQAVTYTQYSKTGILEFPESYQGYLKELSELHPEWTFTAFYTGITFEDFMKNESSLGGSSYSHGKNTVIASAESSWLDSCNVVKSGYACASPDIIAYYADPRNFLTESGIFQFLEMSYNSLVHTKAGVESIIKGTFMEKDITVSGEENEIPVKAKINGKYIMVTPETTIEEIASALKIKDYEITDSKKVALKNTVKASTGYIFTDKTDNKIENKISNEIKNITYDKVYTIVVLGDVNGDGEIKATDYAKIKNYIMEDTKLTEIQKLAADVNEDGAVKATDYAKIKNYIMNSTPITVKEINKTETTTISYADIIMRAAEESGISPYSIAIKIIQEVGRKGSNSVSGTYPGYEGYYNFFNIGAYDSGNAIENGLKYAKEKGWNSQDTAIIEGAKYMSDSYINVGQNTAYFYKFDVVDGKNGTYWHQYMTNVQDPSSQAKNLYNTYTKNNMLDISLNFIIPVYDEMPSVCAMPGTIDPKADTSYYVNGTGVYMRSGIGTGEKAVATLSKNEIVTVEKIDAGEADGYVWAKIIRANGTTGYVANKYLVKS